MKNSMKSTAMLILIVLLIIPLSVFAEEDFLDILLKVENIVIMALGLAFVISLIYIIVLKKKNKAPKVSNVKNQ